MSEYTSTLEGFQRAMEWSLNGPPEEAKAYIDATSTPDYCKSIVFPVEFNLWSTNLYTSRLLICHSLPCT